MPQVLLEVSDTLETVLRPVVRAITQTIFSKTQIPENTSILFPGDINRVQQKGSTVTPDKDDFPVKFSSGAQMFIECVENYNKDTMLMNTVFRPENSFLFRDLPLSIALRPVYSQMTDVSINFKYRTRDRVSAIAWRDQIRNRTAQNREQFVHDIKYSYMVPEEVMVILRELHQMRERVDGYGQNFQEYFDTHRTSRITVATNQAGSATRYTVSESQIRVQGFFDWEGAPEQGEKDEDGETWTIAFSYQFQYDKPVGFWLNYPLMIHNQVVDQKFRPSSGEQPPYQVANSRRSYGLTAKMFGFFESTNRVFLETRLRGYSIPDFDEFLPSQVLPSSMRIFTAMIQQNTEPTKRRLLMNLVTDIIPTGIQFVDGMMCCLRSEQPFMAQPFQSVFCLSLYVGKDLADSKFIEIDENFNVWATQDLPLRKNFHVRLGLMRDLNQINQASINRLMKCGPCFLKILETIDPTLKKRGLLNCEVEGTCALDPACIAAAIAGIKNGAAPAQNNPPVKVGNGQIYQFNTVETLIITSDRNPNQK